MSKISAVFSKKYKASDFTIFMLSWGTFILETLDVINLIASLLLSTIVTFLAFRLNASIPICPVPPNKSRKFLPSISNCMILNSASFTLSFVGRRLSFFLEIILSPFDFPDEIFIYIHLCKFIIRDNFQNLYFLF